MFQYFNAGVQLRRDTTVAASAATGKLGGTELQIDCIKLGSQLKKNVLFQWCHSIFKFGLVPEENPGFKMF